MSKNFKELLACVRGFAFDVDGVLSRQVVTMDAEGVPMRTANIKDGYVLQLAVKLGYNVAIISGGNSGAVRNRYEKLGISDIYMGQAEKTASYKTWRDACGLKDEEVLYMGDDMPDVAVMKMVGVPTCPADACIDAVQAAIYVSPFRGGECCVRDVMEQVLRSQGKWGVDNEW